MRENLGKILRRFVSKPTNFLPEKLTKKKKLLLSFFFFFFLHLLPSKRKIKDSRLTRPIIHKLGRFESTAINKRDKSPRSIFHRRAILSSACFRAAGLASILRSLTLSPPSIPGKSSPRFFRSKPPRDTLNHSPRRNLEEFSSSKNNSIRYEVQQSRRRRRSS